MRRHWTASRFASRRTSSHFSRRSRNGPGGCLGLSLVRRIVEAHGGTIELAPAEDTGTRATIRLPAAAFTNPHDPRIRR
ncbi:HAMP domain-containing histidine kinase [Archangium violaceum]|nr:HAMP domain-containing histidine kinase [Archangium violaceum]